MPRIRFYLESDPFPLDRTDSCFVSTPPLRDRLRRILDGIREGAKPVCICAPPGSGRTTLLVQVRKDLDSQWKMAEVSGASGIDRQSFLDAFGSAFDLAPGDDTNLADVLERLDAHLEATLSRDMKALVAIDDADCRSASERARLHTLLVRRQSSRMRFVTTRQPAAEDSGDEDAPVMLVDIPPLNRAQSDDYIHTRLSVAGLRGDSPFTDDMLRSIHNASGGRPGGIHHVAARMLANWRNARRDKGESGAGRRWPLPFLAGASRAKERLPDA